MDWPPYPGYAIATIPFVNDNTAVQILMCERCGALIWHRQQHDNFHDRKFNIRMDIVE